MAWNRRAALGRAGIAGNGGDHESQRGRTADPCDVVRHPQGTQPEGRDRSGCLETADPRRPEHNGAARALNGEARDHQDRTTGRDARSAKFSTCGRRSSAATSISRSRRSALVEAEAGPARAAACASRASMPRARSSTATAAHHLIEETGQFERFQGRNLDAHMPALAGYRRMLRLYGPMRPMPPATAGSTCARSSRWRTRRNTPTRQAAAERSRLHGLRQRNRNRPFAVLVEIALQPVEDARQDEDQHDIDDAARR